MKIETKVTVYTCDGCKSEFVQVYAEQEIFGYFGNVTQVHDAGADFADWFACKEACIRKAVANAIRREYESH